MQRTVIHLGRNFSIFLADEPTSGRPLIIKEPSDDAPADSAINLLDHEFTVLKDRVIPGIRNAIGRTVIDNKQALLLEYVDGLTLSQFQKLHQPKLAEKIQIAVELARTLEAIHKAKIIHRDISGNNLLINAKTLKTWIIDFGLAVLGTQHKVLLDRPVGTLHYIAPEQSGRIAKTVDSRSDLYSFGVVLFELFTGSLPFDSEDPQDLIHKHVAELAPSAMQRDPTVPAMVSEIIAHLLEKDPAARYQSAAGVAHDLNRCAQLLDGEENIAAFTLKKADFVARPVIAKRLYGREEELAALRAAFTHSRNENAGLVLITGFSGIGKTALVDALQQDVIACTGNQFAGKFEQYKRMVPYSAIVQIVEALSAYVLALPEAQFQAWCARIRTAVGHVGQVLSDAFPSLMPILGVQAAVPALVGAAAQNRFNYAFCRMLEGLAGTERPLVLFIDDLQWIDSSSLSLISELLSSQSNRGILILGAYRDNEVDPSHPLSVVLADAQQKGATIETIRLGNLQPQHVHALLEDALSPLAPGANLAQLTELLHKKSGGNPFYLRRLLTELCDAGQIHFDAEVHGWTWDLQSLLKLEITDNVVAFMLQHLERLHVEVQRLLATAACIGEIFAPALLREALGSEETAFQQALQVALSEDLLVMESGGLRFVHDRIQQAAYNLLDAAAAKVCHLRLGELFRDELRRGKREAALFDAANHLSLSIALITDLSERIDVARLLLEAGQRAKNAGASAQARNFLAESVRLLPADAWSAHPTLTRDIYRELMEAEFLTSHYDRADEIFGILCAQPLDALEMADVYYLHINQRSMQGRYLDAVQTGHSILHRLGHGIAENPSRSAIDAGLLRLEERLAGIQLSSLLETPPVKQEQTRKAARLISVLLPVSYYCDPVHVGNLVLKAWEILLNEGTSSDLAFGISCTATVYLAIRNDYRSGVAMALLAIQLAERLNDPLAVATTSHAYAAFVSHWHRPLLQGMPFVRRGFATMVESGEVGHAGNTFFETLPMLYESGSLLSEVTAEADRALHFVRKTNNRHAHYSYVIYAQLCRRLQSESDSSATLDDDSFSEAQYLAEAAQNFLGLAHYHIYKLVFSYLFGAWDEAFEHAQKAEKSVFVIAGFLPIVTANYFASLAYLKRAENCVSEERQALLDRVERNQRQLAEWAAGAPMNYAHRHALVEGERLRLAGARWEAADKFEAAHRGAMASGQLQDAALSCELAARHFLALDQTRHARIYLEDARHLYNRWGARAKVKQLDALYSNVMSRRVLGVKTGTLHETSSSTDGSASLSFDVSSLLKAARVISGEIVLDRLLERLMQVLIENAGAQHGLLLLPREDQLTVMAARSTGEGKPQERFSQALVSYVIRSGEPLVLEDAARDPRFADTWKSGTPPRSVLCAPLLEKGTLVAVLYLENNLTDGAFSQERLELVKLLGAQAALSLRNAMHYATLEQKVHQRTQELVVKNEELQKTQRQLVLQEKLAALGNLTAGVAHELKNPLNFVNNFAQNAQQLASDLQECLADGVTYKSEDCQEEVADILASFEQFVGKIREHGQRADKIINSMLLHSRDTSADRELVNLNEMVESSLNLAYHGARTQDSNLEITIERDYTADLAQVLASRSDMSRVLLNMMGNAFYSLSKKAKQLGASYKPTLRIATRDAGQHVEIRIRDNGVGISADILSKLFLPFFTTKPPGEGTGLGLSISHDIVASHHGLIKVEAQLAAFAEFIVCLPKVAKE